MTFEWNNTAAEMLRVETNTIGEYWVDEFSLREIIAGKTQVDFLYEEEILNDGNYSWYLEVVDGDGNIFNSEEYFLYIGDTNMCPEKSQNLRIRK